MIMKNKPGSAQSFKASKCLASFALCTFVALSSLITCIQALSLDQNFVTTKTSISAKTDTEGLILEAPPSYVDFKGEDGLKLEISLPGTSSFDYTVMFWFRSVKSYKELLYDDSIRDGKKAYLFEIPRVKNGCYYHADKESGAACYITNPNGDGPVLRCGANDEKDF